MITPGVGGAAEANVLNSIVGKNSLRPVSLACHLYQPGVLDQYLREHAEQHWNLIMLDFIDLCPSIVHFLLALNYKDDLTIQLAIADTVAQSAQNVTERAQALVRRGSVMFLTQVSRDLGLSTPEGHLTIAYRLTSRVAGKAGPAQFQVLSIPFNPETQVLISTFTCNSNAQVARIPHTSNSTSTSENGKGWVHNGTILSSMGDQEHGDRAGTVAGSTRGTILEYTYHGSDYEFRVADITSTTTIK